MLKGYGRKHVLYQKNNKTKKISQQLIVIDYKQELKNHILFKRSCGKQVTMTITAIPQKQNKTKKERRGKEKGNAKYCARARDITTVFLFFIFLKLVVICLVIH